MMMMMAMKRGGGGAAAVIAQRSSRSRMVMGRSSPRPRCLCSSRSSGGGGGGGGGGAAPGSGSSSTQTTIKAGAIGVGAGIFGSLVGMGGAFVMIPGLTYILRTTQHQAHGTSLGAVMTTGAGGALSYGAAGQVDWEVAGYVALLGMVSARLGARTTATLSAATLKRLQGYFQLLVAPTVPLRNEILQLLKGKDGGEQDQAAGGGGGGGDGDDGGWMRKAQLGAIGLGSGFLAGLFGVGGGAIVVPALTLCLPNITHYTALGTSLAAMVPTAIVGTYTHYKQGNVLVGVVLPLAAGAASGSFLGSKYIAMQVPEEGLKWGFMVMMLVLGGSSIRAASALEKAAKITTKAAAGK